MNAKNTSAVYLAMAAMFMLYGMSAVALNLAAPLGNVWMAQPGIAGSKTLGMMGNMMSFCANIFIGIPTGVMLQRIGYKKTSLIAIALGFVGMLIQWSSGWLGAGALLGGVAASFFVYLVGAFVTGLFVCMINAVVSPMLNSLGGGGKRGNQLNMIGCSFNSVCATATPWLVGNLIGEKLRSSGVSVADVYPVLYIAMAIFALAFLIVAASPIANPPSTADAGEKVPLSGPFRFRNCRWGLVAVFIYAGVEIAIPGTMNFWLCDKAAGVLGAEVNSGAVGGFFFGAYMALMLTGRIIASFIGGMIAPRRLLAATGVGAMALIAVGVAVSSVSVTLPIPVAGKVAVPLSCVFFALCGLCCSVMWASVFNLAVEGLGKYTEVASGLFMTFAVGGGVVPLTQGFVSDHFGYMVSYAVPFAGLAYLTFYALFLSRPQPEPRAGR
jgi:FHS family L-fucose permease-like MFS transporter